MAMTGSERTRPRMTRRPLSSFDSRSSSLGSFKVSSPEAPCSARPNPKMVARAASARSPDFQPVNLRAVMHMPPDNGGYFLSFRGLRQHRRGSGQSDSGECLQILRKKRTERRDRPALPGPVSALTFRSIHGQFRRKKHHGGHYWRERGNLRADALADAGRRYARRTRVSGGKRNRHAIAGDRAEPGAERAEKAGGDADRHGGDEDRIFTEKRSRGE